MCVSPPQAPPIAGPAGPPEAFMLREGMLHVSCFQACSAGLRPREQALPPSPAKCQASMCTSRIGQPDLQQQWNATCAESLRSPQPIREARIICTASLVVGSIHCRIEPRLPFLLHRDSRPSESKPSSVYMSLPPVASSSLQLPMRPCSLHVSLQPGYTTPHLIVLANVDSSY